MLHKSFKIYDSAQQNYVKKYLKGTTIVLNHLFDDSSFKKSARCTKSEMKLMLL